MPRKAFSATWPLGKVIAEPFAAVRFNVLWTVDSRSVGNVNMLDFTENAGSQDEITFNEAGADLDIRMEGDADQNLFFLNAGTDKVGIGLNSPSSKLQVDGDITSTHITASGNISSSGTITAATFNSLGSNLSLGNITGSNISASGFLIGIIDGGSF